MDNANFNKRIAIDSVKKMIGNNIAKIQDKMNLGNKDFYDFIFPGENKSEGGKSNAISQMRNGKGLTLDKVITVAVKTKTPIAELFTGVDEMRRADIASTAYDVCRAFYTMLASGQFNIEGTQELQKQGKVISFEKEKQELDKYYNHVFWTNLLSDANKINAGYHHPIYIRIMPRYFSTEPNPDHAMEYQETDEIFTFLKGALELYSCDLPEKSKFHYIRSELEKISSTPIPAVPNDYLWRW